MSEEKHIPELKQLLARYLDGHATAEEITFIERYYQYFDGQPGLSETITATEKQAIEDGNWQLLMERIDRAAAPVHRVHFMRRWWAAASIILALGVASWVSGHLAKNQTTNGLAANTSSVVNYVRNITLPDGSTVVLQAGSQLKYPQRFEGSHREVELIGEAYFDIAHDEEHSFVIHTKKLTTTVLGTAFNIKAWPQQEKIIVSVTRGKVRVENDPENIGGIDARYQQVTWDASKNAAVQEVVKAKKIVTDWTKQNMIFETIPFAEVARVLEKRYGVTITFTNPALQQCLVRSSFDGTETLQKVLKGLALVQEIKYSVDQNNKVLIDGQGCQ